MLLTTSLLPPAAPGASHRGYTDTLFLKVFLGRVAGTVVAPRGNADGDEPWHSVFLPEGSEATLAEMTDKEAFSPRSAAVRDLEVCVCVCVCVCLREGERDYHDSSSNTPQLS